MSLVQVYIGMCVCAVGYRQLKTNFASIKHEALYQHDYRKQILLLNTLQHNYQSTGINGLRLHTLQTGVHVACTGKTF